jgi:hypothetical protein
MRDFWVDGHFITARDEAHARAIVAQLYDGYEAEEVRPWTDEDQEELWEDEDWDPSEFADETV